MDPLSIASGAVGIGTTCYQVAAAIQEYIREVKDVDNVVSQLGSDMKVLSKALNSVHDTLKKNSSALKTNLRNEVNLLSELGACVKECGETVDRIVTILLESKSHGRRGKAIGQIATHWRLRDNKKELERLHSKIVSFHQAINLHLQMIQTCLLLHAQEGNTAKQDNVADELSQLRHQIKRLTRLVEKYEKDDMESLPASVLRSLDVAIALDSSASGKVGSSMSGFRTDGSREPIARVKKWVQASHHWEPPSSKPGSLKKDDNSDSCSWTSSSDTYKRGSSTANSVSRITHDIEALQLSSEGRYTALLRKIPELLEQGNIEPAKSLCRQVIHGSESEFGFSHQTYKEALRILSMIYEHSGDDDEAAQLRMLLNTPGINGMRKEFKAKLKNSSPRECVEYAVSWAVLLYDNTKLHHCKDLLSKLKLDNQSSYSESSILVALSILGNCVLAQTMLSRGVSIDQPVEIDSDEFGKPKITSLECAVFLGHRHLVRILLESNNDDSWTRDRGVSCLKFALRQKNSQLLKLLFEHMPKDCLALNSPIFTQSVVNEALKSKDYKMADILLANVPSYHATPSFVKEILETALNQKDKVALRVILKDARRRKHHQPAVLDGHTKLPFWIKHDLETLELLLEDDKALSMAYSGDNLLKQAVESHNTKMLQVLLKRRNIATVPDYTDPTGGPLVLAVEKKSSTMVELLLKDGTYPVGQAIETAITIRWKKGVELLVSGNKDSYVNEKVFQNLFREIDKNPESQNREIIKLILENCPSIINAALINAILYAHPTEVKLVLRYKPNIDGLIKNGRESHYPLHLAVTKNRLEVVRILVDAGAAVNVKDKDDKTALDHAIRTKAKSGSEFEVALEIIKVLKQAGGTYKSNTKWNLMPRGRQISALLRTSLSKKH